jgi:hypothetical protein
MAHVGPEWSHGMTYDDTRYIDVAKRGGSWIVVDRRGHRSSKGWIVISWQDLIKLIEYPYQQCASYFSESYRERTSKLSVLGLEQFVMGDQPKSFLRLRMSEDKVRTKDLCWSVRTIYDPRGLSGVSTASSGLNGVLHIDTTYTQVIVF